MTAWAAEGRDAYGRWADMSIGGVTQRFRWCPPGAFQMGSPKAEVGRWANEGPRHRVTLTRGFWLADTPCTQEIWAAVMGDNPSRFKEDRRPVETVSWEDAHRFIDALNKGVSGLEARLPSEAEWEYACRAGTETATYGGDLQKTDSDPLLDPIAWYSGNAEGETHDVATKAPNPWGLFDTLGNVWEWCADGGRVYDDRDAVDPIGLGEWPAYRGGAWVNDATFVRAADREDDAPPSDRVDSIGFRLVRQEAP